MAAEILGCHTKSLDRNTIMLWNTKCRPDPSRYIEYTQGCAWRSCTIDRAETKGDCLLSPHKLETRYASFNVYIAKREIGQGKGATQHDK